MTICSKMYDALDKRLEEKKNLDEIGNELCDAVDDPRGKAIRLIKAHKGEKYLRDNAEWLGYDAGQAAIRSGSKKFEPYIPPQLETKQKEEQEEIIDNFAPNETVEETNEESHQEQCIVEEQIIPDSDTPGRIPLKNVAVKCPGCGYGYFHGNWYSPKQMENKFI